MHHWGITGTNGKTTCTWIFAAFVNAASGRKCGYITTVEVFDGKDRYYTGYTTPPLAQLKEIYARMEANGCTDCVMEVSSHAIHQHRTGDTVFSGGAFTNLSEDHLDYHKTMEAYFDVKLDFARQIARARWGESRPPAHLGRGDFPPYVVCMDGGYAHEMFNAVGNLPLNVRPVSIASPQYDLDGLQLVGAYNRSNVLLSAALAEAAGVPREVIQATIPTLQPRWGRLERVENPHVKATVYVDFAHTPDGLEKVLTAMRALLDPPPPPSPSPTPPPSPSPSPSPSPTPSPTPSPSPTPLLWVVFGAGGDRDPMKRPLMGAACAKLADRLVVTSDNPRSEDPMAIIDQILAGIPASAARPFVEPDRAKAIAYALTHAAAGDVVVIAGKGHETTQEIKGVKHPFDDRAVVRDFK